MVDLRLADFREINNAQGHPFVFPHQIVFINVDFFGFKLFNHPCECHQLLLGQAQIVSGVHQHIARFIACFDIVFRIGSLNRLLNQAHAFQAFLAHIAGLFHVIVSVHTQSLSLLVCLLLTAVLGLQAAYFIALMMLSKP